MRRLIRRLLRFEPGISMGQWLWDRITSNWGVLLGLIGGGGVLSLPARYVHSIAAQGWGAVFFAGLGVACLLALVVSISLVAWRYFYPITKKAASPDSNASEATRGGTTKSDAAPRLVLASHNLCHGRLDVSFDNIIKELFIELSFTIFNGTDYIIKVEELRGCITYLGVVNSGDKLIALPAPTLRPGWERKIKAWREGVIVLDQRIPSQMASEMEKNRFERRIMFDLIPTAVTPDSGEGGGFPCGLISDSLS